MPNGIGGSFAPPLDDETLADYKAMIDTQPAGPVKDALGRLYRCCAHWWELPESAGAGEPHSSGAGRIVKLDPSVRQQLDDHVPWNHELDAMHGHDAEGRPRLFEAISPETDRDLRNMAFHLLWHVKELAIGPDQGEWGREPITTDKL